MSKLKIFHFHSGGNGGVHSVISNLLRYSTDSTVEHHVIYTISKEIHQHFSAPLLQGATSHQVFYYSARWNFYYTASQLAKLLPDDKAVVAAHDWLELGMMSNLGLQNPVVFFLHGDYEYYYQLAARHENVINGFITVAKNMEIHLRSILPGRASDVTYLRFPVPGVTAEIKQRNNNIVFIGRLEERKGYHLLPGIANELQKSGCKIHWHIIGEPQVIKNVIWNKEIEVTFYGNTEHEKIAGILQGMKIIILPSFAEGMPVSLVEAMKAGVIPVVNDLSGGIQELVLNGQTGFKIPGNDIRKYGEAIFRIINDPHLAQQLQEQCIQLANEYFEPYENTRMIGQFIVSSARPMYKKPVKTYGSRLDKSWIPNWIVQTIRK